MGEEEFLEGLLEFSYGAINEDRLLALSENVSWARGWPDNARAFWNGEAFMWRMKIDKERRALISRELSVFLKHLTQGELPLDVGCGAYSYAMSVGFDLSEKMLAFNEQLARFVQGDVEESWPFREHEFGVITAIFLLNYVQDLEHFFTQVRRVLKKEGVFFAVLSASGVACWEQRQEKASYDFEEWKRLLSEFFPQVNAYEKEGLWFFVCTHVDLC